MEEMKQLCILKKEKIVLLGTEMALSRLRCGFLLLSQNARVALKAAPWGHGFDSRVFVLMHSHTLRTQTLSNCKHNGLMNKLLLL